MTIGANLNGGSLTLGAAGATTSINSNVTNIPSGTINASYFIMYSSVIDSKPTTWLDTIQSNLNTQIVLGFYNASEVFVGSSKTKNVAIGGDKGTVKIANDGLVAGARVNIATGVNNVGNSQVTIGSSTLSTVLLNGVNVVMNDQTGSKVQIGGKDMGVMYLRGATLYINDGNNTDYINNGNTIIGNRWGSGYTTIESNGISIGKQLSGAGYISIGSDANTTTGYMILGGDGLDASYIRARTIYMNTENGNANIGNSGGTTAIYGNIKMGNNSNTFKNITHYNINQGASYANTYRYVNFGGITFTNPPCLTVNAIIENPGYVGYAQVRSINTTGFYYSLVLHSTSTFAVFFAGDPHILCYTAIGT